MQGAALTTFDTLVFRVVTCELFKGTLPHVVRHMPYRDFVQALVLAEVYYDGQRQQAAKMEQNRQQGSMGGGRSPSFGRRPPSFGRR